MPLERFAPRTESPLGVHPLRLELRGLELLRLRDKRLTREAFLLVTGPVLALALLGTVLFQLHFALKS